MWTALIVRTIELNRTSVTSACVCSGSGVGGIMDLVIYDSTAHTELTDEWQFHKPCEHCILYNGVKEQHYPVVLGRVKHWTATHVLLLLTLAFQPVWQKGILSQLVQKQGGLSVVN